MTDAVSHSRPAGAIVQWLAAEDVAAWTARCVTAIIDALAVDLATRDRALLLVSGGNTPVPVYRHLAEAELDWSRVDIGLVDERWTPPDGPGSNGRLIRETLLGGKAAAARFTPLVDTLDDPEQAARRASDWLALLAVPPSVAVFGMGDDGHTASLFPRAGGLKHALDTDDAYAVVDASGCDGAGTWPTRITLTAAAIAKSRHRFLLVHGATKRRVFENAIAGDDVQALPVRVLLEPDSSPLQVFWYP